MEAPCGLVQASEIFRSSSTDFLPLQEGKGKDKKTGWSWMGRRRGAKDIRTS